MAIPWERLEGADGIVMIPICLMAATLLLGRSLPLETMKYPAYDLGEEEELNSKFRLDRRLESRGYQRATEALWPRVVRGRHRNRPNRRIGCFFMGTTRRLLACFGYLQAK